MRNSKTLKDASNRAVACVRDSYLNWKQKVWILCNSLCLFRVRNLYRSFGASNDRFSHLHHLFLSAFPIYQLSSISFPARFSLSLLLSAIRENAYLSVIVFPHFLF